MKFKMFISLVLFCTMSAFSYSYTAFPIMTGGNTLALNPFLYFDGTGTAGQDVFLSYGVFDNFDVWSHISIVKTPEETITDFSAMLRYDIGKSNIVALRVSQWYITPQYHFAIENDFLGFQANIAGQIAFDYYKEPAFYAVFCPLVKIFSLFDFFIEFNPGYYMHEGDFANLYTRSKGFEFDVVPGIGIPMGEALVSLSCPIYNVRKGATPTFGMWLWCPISMVAVP